MGSNYEKNFQSLCTDPFTTMIANNYKGRPIEEIMEHIYEDLISYESIKGDFVFSKIQGDSK